ncbi:MAG: hypothetical protein WD080_03525 [Egibacteraceae bacterium]
MKKRLITMLLVLLLGAYGAGCDDTVEGIGEDTQEGVSELDDQLNEGEDP